jgi:hypothetical protein
VSKTYFGGVLRPYRKAENRDALEMHPRRLEPTVVGSEHVGIMCHPIGWRRMKAAVIIWALMALCGVALAIFAADGVLKILGILLALVGVIGFLQARRRQNT